MKVDIYRNLHQGCMSIRSRQRLNYYGRVVGYSNLLLLHNCRFVVNEGGRQKVLATKRKNVHAFVRGELKTGHGEWLTPINRLSAAPSDILSIPLDDWVQVTYNPYCDTTFVIKDNQRGGEPIREARMVLIRNNKVYAKS